MINTFYRGILDLIYPPHCLICQNYLPNDSSHRILCVQCLKSLKPNFPPFCLKCSRHLKSPIKHPKCKSCREKEHQFDFAWGAYLYTDQMKHLIHQYKYHQTTQLRLLFNSLIRSFIKNYSMDIHQFDYIIPIPLFPTRLRERGFNQSQLLAEELCCIFDQKILTNTLIRTKNTHYQASLSKKERWTNISGAFRIKYSDRIVNKNILIIDDLLTTGATVSEAAHTLKQAGAKRVGVLTLAIT